MSRDPIGSNNMSCHLLIIFDNITAMVTFQAFIVLCVNMLYHGYFFLTLIVTIDTLLHIYFCDHFSCVMFFSSNLSFLVRQLLVPKNYNIVAFLTEVI